jgi:hypothetical protein
MTEIRGALVSPARSDRLAALQSFASPVEGLSRLESFAKWLFATIATVGTLGVAFSTTGFIEPQQLGKWFFALSVALVGVSLAFAAYSLAPKWVAANPNSIDSMENAITHSFARRRRPLGIAALTFAAALFLAGLTPIASNWPAPWEEMQVAPSLTMSLDQSGALTAKIDGKGLARFSEFTATVSVGEPPRPSQALAGMVTQGTSNLAGSPDDQAASPDQTDDAQESVVMPVAIATADKDGSATVELGLSRIAEMVEFLTLTATYTPRESTERAEKSFAIEVVRRPTFTVPSQGVAGQFRVTLRGRGEGRRKPLVVNATSYLMAGPWIEFTSLVDDQTVQVLRIRSADVDRIRRVGQRS